MASVTQMTSATITGHTMSQSIFGCSKLTNALARALTIAFMWRGPPARSGYKSALNSLPHLRQPFDRNRHGGLQLLGEKLHAQLLEPQACRLEIAREMLQALVGSPFDEPLGQKAGHAFVNVAAGLGKRLG